jgi:hypothetical protein
MGLGLLLSAGQLLPTLELAGVNHRPAEKSGEALGFALDWSLMGEFGPLVGGLFSMAPFGNPSRGTWVLYPQNYAEICGMVGVATVALAAVALAAGRGRDRWLLLGVAAFAALVALGTPLASLLYWVLPGFSRFAGLPRILCLWSLAMALLGGMGLDALPAARSDPALRKKAMVAAGIAGTVMAAAVAWSALSVFDAVPVARDILTPDLMTFGLILAVGVVGVLACLRTADRRILVAVVAGELLLMGFGYNLTSPPAEVFAEPPVAQVRAAVPGEGRVLTLTAEWGFLGPEEAALPPNTGTVFALRDVQGYDSLMPRWAKHGSASAGGPPSPAINGNMVLMGEPGLEGLDPLGLAERGVALLVAGPETAEALQRLGICVPVGRAGRAVLLAPHVAPLPVPRHDGPNRLLIAPGPPDSPPLIRETYARGWRIRDEAGRSVPVTIDEETGFMRLPEEARDARLTGSYEPASFGVGLFLSLTALVFISAGLIVDGARRGRP